MVNATDATIPPSLDSGDGSDRPRVMVIRTAGTNCDGELCQAFDLAGAKPELVHLDAVCRQPQLMDEADIVAIPGGFSYGDDVASGRILAARLRAKVWPAIRSAIVRRVPILGVCNGFQALVQLGLLPGVAIAEGADADQAGLGDAAPAPTVALTDNVGGRFIDRWVEVDVDLSSPCIWTASLRARGESVQLPIAHAEGRLVSATPSTIDAAIATGRAPLRYTVNPNGSAGDIAGLCDASGLIFGLMPHPERYLDWGRGPSPRLSSEASVNASLDTPGLVIFRDAVRYVLAKRA